MKSWENSPLTDEQKQAILEKATELFDQILRLYGWDVDEDPNMRETPKRIAKSWFEIFRGSFDKQPKVTAFPMNEMDYRCPTIEYNSAMGPSVDDPTPIFVGPIRIFSMCSHHFLPIIGYAYVEYRPNHQKVVGLSKIPRLVDWIARRPMIQEKFTELVARTIHKVTEGAPVYVYVEAKHLCAAMRGAEEENALMITEYYIDYRPHEIEAARRKVMNARKDISL